MVEEEPNYINDFFNRCQKEEKKKERKKIKKC